MAQHPSKDANAHASHSIAPILAALGIAGAYFAGAWLGMLVAAPDEVAFIWPAAGILLAGLVLQPRSAWPVTLTATALAAGAANLLAGNPLPISLAFVGANLSESLVAALLLLRVLHGPPQMARLRDVVWLTGGAALLSNGVTALIGTLVPTLAFATDFWTNWRTWWLADGLGMVIVGGAVFAWRTAPPAAPPAPPDWMLRGELFTLIGVGITVGALVVWAPPILPVVQSPYLFFPLLFWAAARFGPRGATTGSLLLAGLLIAVTLAQGGPFALADLAPRDRLLDLQLFLLVLTSSTLILAALIAERTAAQAAVTRALSEREAEIAARTADLEAANQELQREAIERGFQAQLLDSVQQSVIATDLEGRIIYWNRYAETLYGWNAAEVLGRSVVEVTPSAATQEQAAAVMRNLQAGMSWSGNFEVRRRDGTPFPALVTDSPVVNEAGQMIGIVGVSIDMTAQRAAERALQEAQADLEARVAARTQELAATNAQLQAELAERRRAETALAAHLHAQEALAQSAQILLQPTIAAHRRAVIDQALTALRIGVRCSHAFLFQLHAAADGAAHARVVGLSLRPAAALHDAHTARETRSFPMPPAFSARLNFGRPQAGAVAELFDADTPLSTMLHQWGVQTLTLCPVQTLDQPWGVLGFAEQRTQRMWSDYEQLLLRTAADLLRQVLQRWEAEDALAESERRFRAIFNSQFQFIGLLEPDGTVLEANTTALAFGGISPADVIGRPFWEAHWWAAMGPETQAQLREAIHAAANGAFVRYEVDVHGAGEQVETIDFSLKPLHDEHGNVVLLIPEGRIISEPKRAALALKRSEERYRSLVTAAPVGIFETDATGACVFVNERWCAIAGIPIAAALGDGWVASLYPEDRADAFADWSAFVAGERPYHRELRYRHPDGAVRWTIVDAAALHDESGNVIGHLGTVTDMTEQKQAELLLSASLAEKEVLLREIHHRVKNNLQVVSSLLRLQRRRVTDPQVIAALSESEQRVAVMVLVHQLLYQSAGMAGLDARAYLEQLSNQLLHLYDAGAHRVSLQITGDGQHLSLEQAIPCGLLVHELLTNSLKYAFPDARQGIITIDLRRVAPEVVQLQVADTGVGLPDPLPIGTSLGMRLIDGFVRQLRGSITWSSGPGTTATIQFPVGVAPLQSDPVLPERLQP